MIIVGSFPVLVAAWSFLSLKQCIADTSAPTVEPMDTECMLSVPDTVFQEDFLLEHCPEALNGDGADGSSSDAVCTVSLEETSDRWFREIEVNFKQVWDGTVSSTLVDELYENCGMYDGMMCGIKLEQEGSAIINGTSYERKEYWENLPICITSSCTDDDVFSLAREQFVNGVIGGSRRLSFSSLPSNIRLRTLVKNACKLDDDEKKALAEEGITDLECSVEVWDLDCEMEYWTPTTEIP